MATNPGNACATEICFKTAVEDPEIEECAGSPPIGGAAMDHRLLCYIQNDKEREERVVTGTEQVQLFVEAMGACPSETLAPGNREHLTAEKVYKMGTRPGIAMPLWTRSLPKITEIDQIWREAERRLGMDRGKFAPVHSGSCLLPDSG
jgi:hypothetical protein